MEQQNAGNIRLKVNSDSDYNSFSPIGPSHGPETSGGAFLDISTSSASSGAAAIERSPEVEYHSAFELLGFTSNAAHELVTRFVLIDGRPEWPHVSPYECAIFAIQSHATQHEPLETNSSFNGLVSDIVQYGFSPDTCEAFAQRIVGSGAPHDRTLSKWLTDFIKGSVHCNPIPKPEGVEYEKPVPIANCRNPKALQMWMPPNDNDIRDWEKRIQRTLEELKWDPADPNNQKSFYLFHGTGHEEADAIATDGIRPLLGSPNKDFSHGLGERPRIRAVNRGGFYLSRFLPAALFWARHRFENESALLVYIVHPIVFTDQPVRTYDFLNGTEERWQATIQYYKSGCQSVVQAAAAAAETHFDVDSFHCLVGPRSDGQLEAGIGWRGWRQRAPYTGRALDDALVTQNGYRDNNEQYCVKAPISAAHPNGDMALAQRLDTFLQLVVYL